MTAAGKRILIVSGANGAGKTTFAREFLPREANCPTFINADLIASGLSPFVPDRAAVRAGRLVLQLIGEYVDRGESFAFETTLAARNFARSIPRWRAAGYRVTLYFLSVPSPEAAISRVAERVRRGGHGIPEDVIRRRFAAGKENFEKLYKPIVDTWFLYDNSDTTPRLLETGGTHENAKDEGRSRSRGAAGAGRAPARTPKSGARGARRRLSRRPGGR